MCKNVSILFLPQNDSYVRGRFCTVTIMPYIGGGKFELHIGQANDHKKPLGILSVCLPMQYTTLATPNTLYSFKPKACKSVTC